MDARFPVRLRTMHPDDVPVLNSWVSGPRDVAIFGGPTLSYPLSVIELQGAGGNEWTVYVLLARGGPVGTGSIKVLDGGAARIGRVLVDPAERGRGLGRSLMELLLQEARTIQGLRSVSLGVFTRNAGARALYASLGFRETGERTTTLLDGERWVGVQMERPIAAG